AGFATGYAQTFAGLLLCRFLLGLAEAGNWPCALRTTQRILPPEQRTMGNGILQSGAAVGAIITPMVVQACVYWTDSWRYPFLVVGGVGVFWVVFWFALVRREDLALDTAPPPALARLKGESVSGSTLTGILTDRRFYILVMLVVAINIAWH